MLAPSHFNSVHVSILCELTGSLYFTEDFFQLEKRAFQVCSILGIYSGTDLMTLATKNKQKGIS